MMGKIKRLFSLDEVKTLVDQGEGFTFIVEDYREGIKIGKTDALSDMLGSLEEKYGNMFTIRLFNDKKEIFWNGEEGICAELCSNTEGEYQVEEKTIFLEKDTRRYAGLRAFGSFTKIQVQEFEKESFRYIKFKTLIKEES